MKESRRETWGTWLGLCRLECPHNHRLCLAPHGHQFQLPLSVSKLWEAGHIIVWASWGTRPLRRQREGPSVKALREIPRGSSPSLPSSHSGCRREGPILSADQAPDHHPVHCAESTASAPGRAVSISYSTPSVPGSGSQATGPSSLHRTKY